eukprot:m.196615 g.196615  ORF g.196615 m.196615 type:complete len:560 (+) comp18695_c0_seq1:259-1938(+)
MAADEEDLEDNPFFRGLQDKHAKFYGQITSACALICVPSAIALSRGTKISKELLEAHVFKASPYFANQFVSFAGKESRTVLIDAGTVKCVGGFPYGGEAKVLFEETSYNKKSQPYRVLCIDRVLTEPPAYLNPNVSSGHGSPGAARRAALRARTNVQDEADFLKETVGNRGMDAVETEVHAFLDGYIIVQGYLKDVEKKFGDICEQILNGFVDLGIDLSDARVDAAVDEALACYLMNRFFAKIYPVLLQELRVPCKAWNLAVSKCQRASMKDLGVQEAFRCDLSNAVVSFVQLGKARSSMEIHWCINEVVSTIAECVERHLKKNGKGSQAIATDDLLPLLASVLVQAKVANMPAWLFCMESFAGKGAGGKPEFSYTSTTLRAAMDVVSAHSTSFPPAADVSVDITTPYHAHDTTARSQRSRSMHGVPRTGSNSNSTGNGHAPAPKAPPTGSLVHPGVSRGGGYLEPRPYRSLPTSPGSGRRASAPSIGMRGPRTYAPPSPSALARGSDLRLSADAAALGKDGIRKTTATSGKAPRVVGSNATATTEDMGDFLSKLAFGF